MKLVESSSKIPWCLQKSRAANDVFLTAPSFTMLDERNLQASIVVLERSSVKVFFEGFTIGPKMSKWMRSSGLVVFRTSFGS